MQLLLTAKAAAGIYRGLGSKEVGDIADIRTGKKNMR